MAQAARVTHPPLLEWTEMLSVGIEEIDAQHKVLVDLINQINEAILCHRGSEEAGAILQRLAEYTRIHFAVEESLFRLLGYPEYETHKSHHEQLIDQVERLRAKMQGGNVANSFEVLHFLRQWLTHHIMEEDKQYVPFLLSRGVQKTVEKRSWLSRIWGA